VFRDPTLTRLAERALASNQDLRAAAARLAEARALTRAARSRYFPDIDLNPAADRTQFRFRGPGGGSILATNISVPLEFSYEVDLWGKVRRQVEAAKASDEAAAETLRAMQLTVTGEVAQTYWALRAIDAEQDLLGKTVDLRRKALDLLGEQRGAGAISGLVLSRAQTEVADAEAQLAGLDQDRAELVNALAVLCGGMATGSAVRPVPELPAPPAVPVSVPSELLRQRPDIRAAERLVAAANAEIGVAQAAFFPSLTIDASIGYDAAALGNLFDTGAQVWSLGPKLSVPISSAGLRRAQRDAAVAAHQATSAEYRQTVLDAIREVENALAGTAALTRQQQAQDTAAAAARKTLELSRDRFVSGLADFLDVVDAERTRLEAERRARAVRAERLAVSVALIKALGGSWR
jgi:multidrug efflux system outer membrane protein